MKLPFRGEKLLLENREFPRQNSPVFLRLAIKLSIGLFLLISLASLSFASAIILPGIPKKQLQTNPQADQAVLGASTQKVLGKISFNIPSFFTDTATFQQGAVFNGKAVFNNDIQITNHNLDLGTGKLTAANVVYSVTAGPGITVSGGQNPTINNTGVLSVQGQTGTVAFTPGTGITFDGLKINNSGVTSVQGQSGAVTLTAGNGISIDGTTISNTSQGANTFGTIASGGTTIAAGSTNDTVTFSAGSGVTITPDTTTKTLIFSSNVSGNPSFASLTSGTNTVATMIVGSGSSLSIAGSGTINATSLNGNTFAAPGAIGTTTPGTASFTNVTASGTTTFNGQTYTWPSSSGSNGYVLQTNGSGTLSWVAATGGGTNYWALTGSTISPANGASNILIGTGTALANSGIDLEVNGGGNAVLVANQTGTGPIFTASASGTPKFTINNDGSIAATGSITGLTGITSGGTIIFSGLGTGILHSSSGTLSSSAVNLGNSDVTGVLPLANGGTGTGSTPTNGQILIGNGSGYALATISQGSNIVVTNGAGTISIATSTTPSFTTVNGLTITNNGTNTLTIAAGKTLTVNNTITLAGTDATSFTLPTASDTLVGRSSTDTLTNKTIDAGSNTISGLTNANLSGTAGITNANLANSSVTVTAGTGLSGGGAVSLGSSVTLNNAGVLSLTSTQATVSASTGNITISLPQNIDTNSSPYFKGLTLSSFGAGIVHSNTAGFLSSSAISLTADVNGILPLANGGTNANLTADNGGVVYSTGTALAILAHAGSTNQCLLSGGAGAPSWGTCVLGNSYWQLNSNLLSPSNSTYDFAVGGNATSSALFQVFANTGNATTAGTLTFSGSNSQIQTVKNQTLTIGGNSTGDIQFKPGNSSSSLYLASSGNVGIGTTTPSDRLVVNGNITIANGSGSYFYNADSSNAIKALFNSPDEWLGFQVNGADSFSFVEKGQNNNALSTSPPLLTFNLTGSGGGGFVGIGTTAIGNDMLVVNQTNSSGDIFTASQGGTTKFTISNSGNITASNYAGANAVLYAAPTTGLFTTVTTITPNQCLLSQNGSNGTPTWGSCALGTNYWQQNTDAGSGLGVLSPATIANTLAIGITNPLDFTGLEVDQNAKGNAVAVINQTGSGDIFTASSAGSPKFVISSSGNVGIGTTTPGVNLEIAKARTGNDTLLTVETTGTGATNDQANILFKLPGAVGTLRSVAEISAIDQNVNNVVPGILTFSTSTGTSNLTERLRIDNAGNIGINTTTPTSILDVRGTNGINSMSGTIPVADFIGSTSYAGVVIDNAGPGALFTASVSGIPQFTIANNGMLTDAAYGTGIAHISSNGIFSSSAISLNTADVTNTLGVGNGGTGVNSIAAGTLLYGSGTTSPMTALAIGGNNQCLLSNGTNPVWGSCALGNNLWQQNSGVLAPTNLTNDLAVGGSATSSALFQVFGNTGNATTAGTLTFTGTGSQIQTVKDQTLTLGGNSTGDIQFKPGNSGTSLYLASGGNVGVGTSTPTLFTLQVAGNVGPNTNNTYDLGANGTAWRNLYVNNIITPSSVTGQMDYWTRTASGGFNYLSPTTTGDLLAIGQTTGLTATGLDVEVNSKGNAAAVVNQKGSGDIFTASSSGLNRFVITQAGNVGIGTTNPANVLQVNGTFGLQNSQTISGVTNYTQFSNGIAVGGATTFTITNAGVGTFASGTNLTSNGPTYFQVGSTAGNGSFGRMYADLVRAGDFSLTDGNANSYLYVYAGAPLTGVPTGSMGIGTNATSPHATLDVEGGNTGGNAGLIVNQMGASTNDIFTASAGGATKFVINSTGNVGIGTTNPGYRLDVQGGSINTSDNIVKAGTRTSATDNTLYTTTNTTMTAVKTWTISVTGDRIVKRITLSGDIKSASVGTSLVELSSDPNCNQGFADQESTTSTSFQTIHISSSGTKELSHLGFTGNVTVYTCMNTSSSNTESLQNETLEVIYEPITAPLNRSASTDNTLFTTSNSSYTAVKTWTISVTGDRIVKRITLTGDIKNSSASTTSMTLSSDPNCNNTFLDQVNNSTSTFETEQVSGYDPREFDRVGYNGTITLYTCLKAISNTASVQNETLEVVYTTGANEVLNVPDIYTPNNNPQIGSDVAEYIASQPDVEAADVVVIDQNDNETVEKATIPYDSHIAGIIGTKSYIINDTTNGNLPLALAGRVPVKVSTINGPIHIGDLLTSSSIPGVAMKATRPGFIVGKAYENYTNTDSHVVGKVIALVNVTWADPGVKLTNSGDLNIADSLPQSFAAAPPITDQAVLAASATSLNSNLTATTSGSMTDALSQLGSEVSILQTQYASLSAQMTKLSAIDDLSKRVEALETLTALSASDSARGTRDTFATRDTLTDDAGNATVSGQLSVLGKTLLSDVGITGKISMGLLTIDGMGSNPTAPAAEINTLAGPLKIQPLGLGGVDFLNGKVLINTLGNMTVNAAVTAKVVNTTKLNIIPDTDATASAQLSASAGSVILKAGQTSIDISTTALTSKSLIFTTPDQPVLVGAKIKNSDTFTIKLKTAQASDIKVNWWIVN